MYLKIINIKEFQRDYKKRKKINRILEMLNNTIGFYNKISINNFILFLRQKLVEK
jgi:hypothetical protein